MSKPIFILAGQSNANRTAGVQDEIVAAFDAKFGIGGYHLAVSVRSGSPLTRTREGSGNDGQDWMTLSELPQMIIGGQDGVRDGLEEIVVQDPDAYAAGMIWIQGESDATSGSNPEAYAENFLRILEKLETEVPAFGTPAALSFADMSKVKVVVSELGDTAPAATSGLGQHQSWGEVLQQHEDLATNYGNIFSVDPDDVAAAATGYTGPTYADNVHYAEGFKPHLANALVEEVSTPHVSVTIGTGTYAGDAVTERLLGANQEFGRDSLDAGRGVRETIDSVGLTTLRYPGGTKTEQHFDLENPNATLTTDVLLLRTTGEVRERTVTPLEDYITFVNARGSDPLIVLPTYRYYDNVTQTFLSGGEQIYRDFVTNLMNGVYGDVDRVTVEIGNEFYQGESGAFDTLDWANDGLTGGNNSDADSHAFGHFQAAVAAVIDSELRSTGHREDVTILAQAGQGSRQNEILDDYFAKNSETIDGLLYHYYTGLPGDVRSNVEDIFRYARENENQIDSPTDDDRSLPGRVQQLRDFWEDKVAGDLKIAITEWGVSSEAFDENGLDPFRVDENGDPLVGKPTEIVGMQRIAPTLYMFAEMVRAGVDIAAYHQAEGREPSNLSTTRIDGLTPAGYFYEMLVESTVGLSLVDDTGNFELTDASGKRLGYTYTFEGQGRSVTYLASASDAPFSVAADVSSASNEGSYVYYRVLETAPGDTVTYLSDGALSYETQITPGEDDTVSVMIQPFQLVELHVVNQQGVSLNGDRQNEIADVLIGTAFDDIIGGDLGDDSLEGGGGNDTLDGGIGNDVLDGGAGNDTLTGGAGDDTFTGGSGDDRFVFDTASGNDVIQDFDVASDTLDLASPIGSISVEQDGDDVVVEHGDSSTLRLLLQDEAEIAQHLGIITDLTLTGTAADDTLQGGSGNDTLSGLEGDDSLLGEGGSDTLFGDDQAPVFTDLINNGDFSDTSAGTGLNAVPPGWTVGGPGGGIFNDVNGVRSTEGRFYSLGAGSHEVGNSLSQIVSTIAGESYALNFDAGALRGGRNGTLHVFAEDLLLDAIVDNTQSGLDSFSYNFVAQSDSTTIRFTLASQTANEDFDIDAVAVLGAGGGDDTLDGGAGNDSLFGGFGDDTLTGGAGADVLDGGGGSDTVDYSAETSAISVRLNDSDNSGAAAGDQFVDVENIIGTDFDDVLSGDQHSNRLVGGDGNDQLNGGSGGDALFGGDGNDNLNGQTGDDTMEGGVGNDRFFVDSVGDVVIEQAGEGIDTLTTSVSITLPDNVENASTSGLGTIAITGNDLNNFMTGNNVSNTLSGEDGNDRLQGQGGNDTLIGGGGNDILEGQTGADVLKFGADDGNDTAFGFELGIDKLDFTALGLRYVDLVLLESAGSTRIEYENGVGGTASVNLQGIAVSQITSEIMLDPTGGNLPGGPVSLIEGSSNNDVLSGDSGSDVAEDFAGGFGDDQIRGYGGDDTMVGGFGNDRYFVTDAGDVVIEQDFQGVDQVDTTVSLTLAHGIEKGAVSGNIAVDITGNELANFITGSNQTNVLTGGAGNDRLIARGGDDTLNGGLDRDVLEGGAGADVFVFETDSDLDLITDFEVGIDVIDVTALGIAYADMTIQDGPLGAQVYLDLTSGSVDLITFTGVASSELLLDSFITVFGDNQPSIVGTTGDDNLIGSQIGDELLGLDGNDRLIGGLGSDTLIGGSGDDRYFVDNSDDLVIELAGEGTDTVSIKVDFVLPDHVENMNAETTDAVSMTGNTLANTLTGNDASNMLTGLSGNDNLQGKAGADIVDGGAGNDVLRGGADADTFVFDIGDGVDQIIDFEVGIDIINLSATGLTFGDLLIQDSGSNVTVKYAADTITLLNTTEAELDASQFDFT